METIEMLRGFLGLGIFTLMFGLFPGMVIGARFHKYIYEDED